LLRSISRPALALCLLTAVQGRALAQAPPPPDTLPIAAEGTPEYLRSLRSVPGPVVIAERSYRVLVAAAPTAATLDEIDALDTLARACAAGTRRSDRPPGYSTDGVAIDGTKYLVVVATHASAVGGDSCEARWNAGAPSIWRAISFGGFGDARIPMPRSLRLLVDGVEIRPSRAVARPAFELRNGTWTRVASQLRYYYPMSVIAPTARSSRRTITVQLWDARGSASSFELLSTDVQRLRFEYDAWRLATTPGKTQPVRLAPRHSVSGEVRDALELAARGETSAAALRASEHLALTGAGRSDEYSADVAAMLVAEALFQLGDTAAARGTVADVGSQRSCLSAPSGASLQVSAATSRRARASCVARSPLSTLALGFVVPGGGHMLQGNRVIGGVALAVLTGVFVSAYSTEASAKDIYARYEGSRSASEAIVLFQQANAQRAAARARARVGVALWGADAALAAIITSARNHVVSHGRL
jgi:hypothetical protein